MNRYRWSELLYTKSYRGGKSPVTGHYLSLTTFKKIVLGLIIIFIVLLTPHLGYASVIEVGPTTPTLSEGNAILKNFSIEFSNRTNATLENYVTSQEKGDAIILAINTILMDQDYEPLVEEEEELEEEREESESSSSSESSDDDSGPGLIPQPGDEQTFPEDAQPQPFPEPDPNNGSDPEGGETDDSDGSEGGEQD